jgi:hypothetical protein
MKLFQFIFSEITPPLIHDDSQIMSKTSDKDETRDKVKEAQKFGGDFKKRPFLPFLASQPNQAVSREMLPNLQRRSSLFERGPGHRTGSAGNQENKEELLWVGEIR